MNIHHRCPACDQSGVEVTAQDGEALVCMNSACRVFVFATYLG